MATKETIQALYERYLNNDISRDELELFLQMLHIPEDELTVSSLMDGTWQGMFETKKSRAIPIYKRNWFRFAAAAVILICISSGAWFIGKKNAQKTIDQTVIKQRVKNDVVAGGNKAVLKLANGTEIILDSASDGILAQQGNTKIIKLNSGQLAYNALNEKPGLLLYNTITTPRGGQYQIVLADGSKVWLNASSSLRFPTFFTGKERNVELTGEGYFEIAPLTSGIGGTGAEVGAGKIPFIVKINTLKGDGGKVEVLGTHFNIMAYGDEPTIKTTLLEGSVQVWSGNKPGLLKPGQQAIYNNASREFHVTNADTEKEMAWKNGLFIFKRDDIKTIIRQIDRWYDVDISYTGQTSSRLYSGSISKYVNASEVLKILELGGIKFRIQGKKITVL